MVSIAAMVICIVILDLDYSLTGQPGGLLTTIMILVISVSMAFDLRNNRATRSAMPYIFAGYLFRVFLLYLDIYGKSIYHLPNSGKDSEMFFNDAVTYSTTGNAGRGGMFSRVMGSLFAFTGPNRLFGQFVIILFSILAICALATILFELDISDRYKVRTIGVVSLLPNFAILSAVFLRESIVIMFLAFSAVQFTKWMHRGKESFFIFAFVLVFVAALFHSGSVAMGFGYIIIRLLYNKRTMSYRGSLKNILPSVALGIVMVYLYLRYGDVLFSKMNNIDSLEDIATSSSEGGSSYAAYVGNSNSILNMLIYTIPRMVYFLFSPFPWQWRGLNDIIAFVFSSVFYFMVIYRGMRATIRKTNDNWKYLIAFLIVAASLVFVFAWGVSNTGTATRHRDKMIIVFGVIYALTDVKPKTRQYVIQKF